MHHQALQRLAALLVQDAHLAEEIVQESFIAMHRGWPRLRDTDAALAYLRQAVVNRSRSVIRHRSAPRGEHQARVRRVAQVLTAVSALDDEVADQILGDFELALAVRRTGFPGQPGPGPGSRVRSPSVRPGVAGPGSAWPGIGSAGIGSAGIGRAGIGSAGSQVWPRHPARPAGSRPGWPPVGVHGLGDVIAALQAAGALSPLNPVPGQLAALCARLDLTGHGITEPSARDLPEPWLSMLAYYQRRKARAAPARDGCAAVAAVLAELDGVTLAILGLHNCAGSTVLHIHASGPMADVSYAPEELYYWPVIWIRDSGGRWHTTRTRGRSGMNGEVALRLEVIPPLSRATAWIEVHAAGRSIRARATLPLRWE